MPTWTGRPMRRSVGGSRMSGRVRRLRTPRSLTVCPWRRTPRPRHARRDPPAVPTVQELDDARGQRCHTAWPRAVAITAAPRHPPPDTTHRSMCASRRTRTMAMSLAMATQRLSVPGYQAGRDRRFDAELGKGDARARADSRILVRLPPEASEAILTRMPDRVVASVRCGRGSRPSAAGGGSRPSGQACLAVACCRSSAPSVTPKTST
jgi:hypothetical protein